jgi:hypothetical protein
MICREADLFSDSTSSMHGEDAGFICRAGPGFLGVVSVEYGLLIWASTFISAHEALVDGQSGLFQERYLLTAVFIHVSNDLST